MKKLFSMFLTLLLSVAFIGCGGDTDYQNDNANQFKKDIMQKYQGIAKIEIQTSGDTLFINYYTTNPTTKGQGVNLRDASTDLLRKETNYKKLIVRFAQNGHGAGQYGEYTFDGQKWDKDIK